MITTTTQSAPKCASNGRAMPEWMTAAQVEAYEVLAKRWGERAAAPVPEICGSAALVECVYESGGSMWIGIERDGYTRGQPVHV